LLIGGESLFEAAEVVKHKSLFGVVYSKARIELNGSLIGGKRFSVTLKVNKHIPL